MLRQSKIKHKQLLFINGSVVIYATVIEHLQPWICYIPVSEWNELFSVEVEHLICMTN